MLDRAVIPDWPPRQADVRIRTAGGRRPLRTRERRATIVISPAATDNEFEVLGCNQLGRAQYGRGRPYQHSPWFKNQSNGATVNHAQAPAPIADSVRDSIVDFELGLHTAQVWDLQALELQKRGAKGGPDFLLGQSFTVGQNAPGPGFNRDVFGIYDAWADLGHDFTSQAREDIAEGQRIFNTRTFTVTTPTGGFFKVPARAATPLPM